MALIRADTDRVTLSGEHYTKATLNVPFDKQKHQKYQPYQIENRTHVSNNSIRK